MFGVGVGVRVGGFTASGGGGFDPDAQAFFDRVTTAGGTLSTTEKNATNQLVLDMKSAGIWSSMKAVYPMVGASAAACAQNLKSSSFTGTFTSGWTFASTGVKPNGTNAYCNTNLPNNTMSQNSMTMCTYLRTDNTITTGDLGVWNGGFGSIIYSRNGLGNFAGINNSTSANVVSVSVPNSLGFFLNKRTSSSQIVLQRNSTQSTLSSNSQNLLTSNFIIARTGDYSGEYSDRETAFVGIGDGLTDTQASNFYTAVQTFNQALNRQVGAQIVSDADAQAYINRVYTAGGTLTNTEANAVNQLTIDMKAAGIWTAMKAIYPMVGASAAACAQNLKSSSFTGTFTSGWTFASTGATPNGTSAFMDTALTASVSLSSINNLHLSFYSRTQNTTTGGWNMGVDTSTPNTGFVNLGQYFAAVSQKLFNNGYYPTYAVTSTQTNTRGLVIGVAESSVLRKLHFNGSLLATTTTTTISILPSSSFYVGSGRNSTTGNAADFSPHECAFASIGDGLTDTQASNFYTAVQAFQTTLARQIAP